MLSLKATIATVVLTSLGANAKGWDDCDEDHLGRIEPSPARIAAYMYDDRDGTGSSYAMYTGYHPSELVGEGWNDRMSSIRIKFGFACSLYNHEDYGGCMQTQANWGYRPNMHRYYINSWDNILSSFKCGRLCTEKQDLCVKHDWSQCATLENVFCEECEDGYVPDDEGNCIVDPECVSISVEIFEIGDVIADDLPESVDIDSLTVDACGQPTQSSQTVSDTEQSQVGYTSTYSHTESWSEAFSYSFSQELSVTYDGGVAVAGVGSSWEIAVALGFGQEQSSSESGSETSSAVEMEKTVNTWSQEFTFIAPPYSKVTYTSTGSKTPGSVPYKAYATCITSLGTVSTQHDVVEIEGVYRGASITHDDITVATEYCGADDAFDFLMDTLCPYYYADVEFDTLYEAQEYCDNTDCIGIYDEYCDGKLGYRICVDDTDFLESSYGSCIYKLKAGDPSEGVRRIDLSERSTFKVRDALTGDLLAKVESGEAKRGKDGSAAVLPNGQIVGLPQGARKDAPEHPNFEAMVGDVGNPDPALLEESSTCSCPEEETEDEKSEEEDKPTFKPFKPRKPKKQPTKKSLRKFCKKNPQHEKCTERAEESN